MTEPPQDDRPTPPSPRVPAMNEVWSGLGPADPIDGHRSREHGWWHWPVGGTVVSIGGGLLFFIVARIILVVTGWAKTLGCYLPVDPRCAPRPAPQYAFLLVFAGIMVVLLTAGYLLPRRREWHTTRVLLAVLGCAAAFCTAVAGAVTSVAT